MSEVPIPERTEYGSEGLRSEDLRESPIAMFHEWFVQAVEAEIPEANGACLSTYDEANGPDGRIVLLKDYDERGFQIFTNYEGGKGRQLAEEPRASLVFWWQSLRRQVRIRGTVVKLSDSESAEYFASRPRESQLGAWASLQSQPIASRSVLDERLVAFEERFAGAGEVPKPPYWGGYLLEPRTVEFWRGRDNRLHDRFVYTDTGSGRWSVQRLMP